MEHPMTTSTSCLLSPVSISVLLVSLASPRAHAAERGLIGHWRLAGDVKDSSGQNNHGKNHGADLTATGPDGKPNAAALFNGKTAFIEIAPSKSLSLGKGDFTFTVWAHTDERLDDVLGDLVGKYDPIARRGIN